MRDIWDLFTTHKLPVEKPNLFTKTEKKRELTKHIGMNTNTEQKNRILLINSALNKLREIFKGDLLKGWNEKVMTVLKKNRDETKKKKQRVEETFSQVINNR